MRPRAGVLLPLFYGAGLATGLLRFGDPSGAVLMLLAAALVCLRRPLPALLASVAGVGALSGTIALAADARGCAAVLPEGSLSLELVALDPVFDGGLGRARPNAGCRGAVVTRWPGGTTVEAGTRVHVTARWIPRRSETAPASGTLVVGSAKPAGAAPTVAERIRTATARSIRRLYGTRAPVVGALVLNARGELDTELRDRFVQSGLVHILSISGFHVGLIAAWVVLIARALGAGRRVALGAGAGAAISYVALLDWPAPATRAAALATLLAVCLARQRRVQPDAMLAFSCLVVMLVDPWSVLALGAWLSAGALWGATRFTRWSDRAFGEGHLPRTLFSSIGATLATAPLTAALLGTVAPIGIAINLAAIPVAAVAVPGVLASLAADQVSHGLASAFAGGAGLALHGLELLARLGSSIPGGHLLNEPSAAAALPWALGLLVTLWAIGRRNTRTEAARRAGWALAIVSWSGVVATRWSATDAATGLTLHFLDVGQGDAAVLRTPGGHWVLIDAGPIIGREDAGRRVVLPFLARHGVTRLSAVVISHAHADHVGGAAAVLTRVPADAVLEPGRLYADPAYYGFLDAVAAHGDPWHVARAGQRFALDGVTFTVLHPDTTWAEWGTDLNEDSAVLRVEYGAFSALFAGDAGIPAEHLLAGHVGAVDLLKVGHHGSRGASGDAWLDELAPRAAIVSVGRRNRYGHPAPEALERLARHHADVWRTDREGTITVTTDGRRMTVRGSRGSVTYPVE